MVTSTVLVNVANTIGFIGFSMEALVGVLPSVR
jgi:hypothetical protein